MERRLKWSKKSRKMEKNEWKKIDIISWTKNKIIFSKLWLNDTKVYEGHPVKNKWGKSRWSEGRSVSFGRYLGVCCFFSSLSSICYQHYNQSNCHHNYDECHHFYCNYCFISYYFLIFVHSSPYLISHFVFDYCLFV